MIERHRGTVLLTFIATTWLLAMLPGVGQALMLRQTLVHGPAAALATIGGTATGLVLWGAGTAAGLSALLLTHRDAYRVLVLAGAGFLVVMGLRTVWSARRSSVEAAAVDADTRPTGSHSFLTGLATNLGNPKAGVFAVALLPQFVGAAAGFWPMFSLGILWSAVTAAWYLLFVMLVARGRGLVRRPVVQRGISALSGAVLVGLGTAMLLGA